MIKKIKYFLEAVFIYSFFCIIKIFGLSLSRPIFSCVFKFLGPIVRSNKIVMENLLRFSKKLSTEKKKQIISNMWSNYGMTFVEYLFLKKFRENNSHIEINGEEILNKIKNKNKPVIFISGHFANFELMSMEITKKEIKLATVYRPLNNIFLNPLMEYFRKKYICKNQIKKGISGVREAVEYIKQGHCIALMIDQRVSEGEKIKFFSEKALTTTFPAQLAKKFNLEIVPIFIERKFNNQFEINVYDPIDTMNFNNKIELTEKLNRTLENMIVKNPNQWIWTHNRWK